MQWKRGSEWFISSTAAALSGSSQMQAYGPNVTLCCLLAYWAFCGPESWPMVGFLVIFRPWGLSRRHFFFVFFVFFNYCCYFYLFFQFFLLFSALFIFFCFLLYFLIVFAFSFRKFINFLLVPLVFKYENTF